VGWRLQMGGGVRGASSKPRERGAAAQEKGERGGWKKSQGIKGGAARVRGTSGPDHEPRPNSFTRQPPTPLAHESNQNSTILLVNASPKIPNPKRVPPERKKEKRNKERINSNFSSLQIGYHTCGHNEVRLDDGDGRNRPVHVRRRASSSAASAPAYPRWYRSIQGHGELHGVLTSRPVQGIEEQLTVELGLRSPMVGWSPVTLIWRLRRGRARFLNLGASLRHVESIPRVGRGWGWLCWPVYGGGCSGGRWHAIWRANYGDLVLRWGRECAGAYGWSLGWLYRHGHGQGTQAWLGAPRGARGQALGMLWRVQGASNTWRCSSAHVQQLAEIANMRILAKIRRRPPPSTCGCLLYVSSNGRYALGREICGRQIWLVSLSTPRQKRCQNLSNEFGSVSNFSSGCLRWFGTFLVFRPSGFGAIY
jgi:hypothetical protein